MKLLTLFDCSKFHINELLGYALKDLMVFEYNDTIEQLFYKFGTEEIFKDDYFREGYVLFGNNFDVIHNNPVIIRASFTEMKKEFNRMKDEVIDKFKQKESHISDCCLYDIFHNRRRMTCVLSDFWLSIESTEDRKMLYKVYYNFDIFKDECM